MNLKSAVVAVAIAASSVASFAANVFVGDTVSFDGLVTGAPNAPFSHSYSFTGLASGLYNVEGTIAGTAVTFTSVLLNGAPWTQVGGGNFKFGEIFFTGVTPFFVSVTGFKGNTTSLNTKYTGSLTVTPVPEPETFAMLLAGLGLMGAIARRRNTRATA